MVRSLSVLVLLLGFGHVVQAEERWSGAWSATDQPQSGRIEFRLADDGRVDGRITNGGAVGSWTGVVRTDGIMVADYAYPGFAATAIVELRAQAADHVGGRMFFVSNGQVFSEGNLDLYRVGQGPQAPAGNYPFVGPGMKVYCGAASICGQRGGNALPGNWGWTSGLFGDIKRSYPQVWCNLYPGSC